MISFRGMWALQVNGLWLRGRNLIPNSGRTAFAQRIAGDTLSMPSHIAFGTGSNTPALGDIGLQAEIYAYDAKTNGVLGTRLSSDSKIFEVYLDTTSQVTYSGATFTAKEVGIFGRVAGKTAVLYARFLIQDLIFSTGFKWRASWTMPFNEKED